MRKESTGASIGTGLQSWSAKKGRRGMPPGASPIPTESEEQMTLMSWASLASGAHPELRLLYHVPNGGSRGKAEAGRFRAEGVKSGVPDLCLPVARGEWHGLYIELKRTKGGHVSPEQERWISALREQGYAALVARGWEQAREIITEYLEVET